jgi:hypothetical protein
MQSDDIEICHGDSPLIKIQLLQQTINSKRI